MKIGMMVDAYKPYISGVTNHVEISKKYMEMAGHTVYIFTFGDNENTGHETGIMRSPGLLIADTGFHFSLRYSRQARQILQTMDVVHVHHPFLSGRLAMRYCHPANIPLLYTNHTRYDLYAQTYLPIMPEEISQSILQSYMPAFCESMDLTIAPSQGMANVLRGLNVNTPIEVIPNGVEMKRFINATPLHRADFGFNAKDLLLIYAGRIAPEKNIPLLLQSIAGVIQAVPNIKLLVLGKSLQRNYEEHIRKITTEINLDQHVRFTGSIPYEQIPGYLAMCDIFVTASVTEVHPLSVIEAMGAGLPVMGIQSVGIGDTVEDGITGYLSTNDPAAFAAKLTRLCLDPNLRSQMSTASRRASTKYEVETTTQIMLQHYEQVIHEAIPKKADTGVNMGKFLDRIKSMTKHNQQVGAWGEETAAKFLAEKGHQIIARNVRTPYGEIDIVTLYKENTIFVEVKTLTSSKNFFPEHNITARKREHMTASAEHYAAENNINHWQIDVISIEGKPGTEPVITHFENAI